MLIFLMASIFGCESNTNNTTNTTTASPSNTSKTEVKKTNKKKKKIMFFGDSLTAGYGLDDPSESYVGVIQEKLDSLKRDYQVINAGVSGETSSGGNERIDWVLEQSGEGVDIFILELGANDGLRGIEPDVTIKNLQAIFDKVKAKFPKTKLVLLGMLAPPNMGGGFTKKFAAIFPKLAKENAAAFVPFLLDGVGGIPELNQKDGIHPTQKGHRILADNVWKVLGGMTVDG
ncbi:MAG TPA: arylesterase [Phaeodactylibacter sp.]|nr:arylesterase [Phaeodactylibacter sp.]